MKNKLKFFLILIVFILFNISAIAQNWDSIRIKAKLDSLYPNKSHLKWHSPSNAFYEISFEYGDYFFRLTYISTANYKQWNIDSSKVDKKAMAKFDSLYPNSTSIEWTLPQWGDTSSIVNFDCNCKENYSTVIFDVKGNIIGTDRILTLDMVPNEISKYLKKNYSKYILNNLVDEKINKYGNIQYYVRLDINHLLCNDCEFYWVIFDKDGNFISKEHVAGGL